MLRFFIGLTLAQLSIVLLVLFVPVATTLEKSLLVLFVIFLQTTVITLWFSTVTRHIGDQRIADLKEQFANEREKINVSAERAQKRLLKKTQKEIESERRKLSTRANLKIGGAFAVAAGFGVVMLLSQFFTLGLLTLTTAGGALGGYLARSRKEPLLTGEPEVKMIEGVEVIDNENTDVPSLPDQSAPTTTEPADSKPIQQ